MSTQEKSNSLANQTEDTTIGSVIDTQVSNVLQSNLQSFNSAFVISKAIQKIDNALTAENMKPVMELQGKKLGFRTDKIYQLQVVKECVIEAVLQGLNVVGNHFNIIAGNMYITKEGYGFLLSQIKDLRYNISYSILEEKNGYTDVQCKITWKFEGKDGKKQIEIFPVKSGKYGTPDNILGKAERKSRKWLYDHIAGKETSDGAIDIDHTTVQTEMEVGKNANQEELPENKERPEPKQQTKAHQPETDNTTELPKKDEPKEQPQKEMFAKKQKPKPAF